MSPFRRRSKFPPYLVALLLSALFFFRIFRSALRLPEYIDETIAVEAAANFIRTGNYTSALTPAPFDPGASSGFAATWPGGVGWLLTGTMFGARMASGLVVWAEGMLLGWLFFRRLGYEHGRAFVGAASVCLLAMFLPLGLSFLWDLAEIPAAIWIGLGLMVVARRPVLGFFLFGMAVWQGKLLYLIQILCLATAWFVATRRNREGRAPVWLVGMAFLVPLLIWMAVIWARFDLATVHAWAGQYVALVHHGHSGLAVEPDEAGWLDRLARHWGLWVALPWKTMFMVGALVLGPVAMLVRLRRRLPSWRSSRLGSLLLLGVVAGILAHAAWFFLFDPYLWLRHLQPALCLGFGALCYMAAAVWRPGKRSIRS